MKTTFTMIFGLFIVLLSVGTSISNGDFPYISDAKYFADFVISSSIGPCPGVPDRQNPMNALEYTNTGANANLYFFSMGKSSGEIVVKFVCPIINGDGPDLEIIEDTWTGGYQIETADVYAKAKLEDEWTKLGSASNFNGNNGPQAINKFELILDCAQYIRVVDTTFAPSTCSGFDGFDLNSIGSLQPNENCDQCICEKSFSIPLLAGQTIDIGTINITETDGEICVTYSTTGDWWITQIHLAIENNFDAFILNKNDNPKIGQFEFSQSYDPAVQLTTAFCKSFECAEYIYISAHADVVRIVDGQPVQYETAWGSGDDFGGSSWAMYYKFPPECLETCE